VPTLWGLTGTATASRTETALLTGSVTVRATPSVYASGTATVDRATLSAWASQIRRTATRVFLGDLGEDMVRLRDAVAINIDSTSPVATATFRLTDERCAFFADDSIATGGIPVSIRCRISTDTATADTTVFSGLTEGMTNEDPYVPTATIQCAGTGAEWLDAIGCIALAAFGGYTRAEILRQFAEAADVDSTRIVGGEGSGVVNLAMDLSGLSVWELARRFAEIEDWYVREDGGDLYLLPATDVVGAAAYPIFAFEPSNYFSLREDPPIRPVTKYILSTVGIPDEVLSGGTEETTTEIQGGTYSSGIRWETRTTTTSTNGVVTSQRIEEWRDAAIPGVTPRAVAWRLWRLTVTETDWQTTTYNGVTLRTSRIDGQTTTVSEWYSAPCRSSSGYVWDDGSRHIANAATFQVIEERVTTYTYDPSPSCLLTSKLTLVGGWYSEIVDSGQTYDDGSVRADNSYPWTAYDAAQPYQKIEETYSEESSDAARTVESSIVTSRWYTPSGATEEAWGEAEGSTTRWTTTPGSGVIVEATSEFLADGSTAYSSKSYAGELPVLARASADIPQFRTVPLVLTATAEGDRYAVTQSVETIWGAESLADLTTVARRRFRDTMSPRVTILHPALPLLKVFDVVTVTDPARELDEKQGYVASYRLALDPLNGGLRQETTVVFPLAEYDPEVTA